MNRSGRAWSIGLFAVSLPVLLGAASQFRAEDWPLYLAFLILVNLMMPFVVEVLPRLGLCLPELAVTLGFLYIAGAPIAVLFFINAMVVSTIVSRWPPRGKQRLGAMSRLAALRDKGQLEYATEASTFALGLIVRWHVASAIAGPDLPLTDTPAILAAEACGYAAWSLLSVMPFYPGRGRSSTLLPLSMPAELFRSALVDMGLVSALTLTPFVLLVSYGYQAGGIVGAAAASLAALAPHFTLKRLIDRRRRVEEQNRALEELNRELRQRERLSAIGKMSTIVSHQILQHLGVIGLHAHLIRTAKADLDDAVELAGARDNAAAIEQSLAGVNRVLQDLLIFSRDQRVNLYEHTLHTVLDECVRECERTAADKRVTVDLGPGVSVVARFDKLKVKQAVVNVVRNAIQASPDGGRVTLSSEVDGEDISILIADQGPGIPESQREQIFAPFHSTKEEGTGLGLAIARIFAQAHGGDVTVRPETSGRGAVFAITLPGSRVDSVDADDVAGGVDAGEEKGPHQC